MSKGLSPVLVVDLRAANVRALGELASGAPCWVLQQYHSRHALAWELRELKPHPVERIRAFAELAGGTLVRWGCGGFSGSFRGGG